MQDDDEDVEEICTPDLHVPSSDTRSSQSHVNQNVDTFSANKLFNMVERPKRRGRPRKYVDYGVFCQDDLSSPSTSSKFNAGIKVAVGANSAKAFVPFPPERVRPLPTLKKESKKDETLNTYWQFVNKSNAHLMNSDILNCSQERVPGPSSSVSVDLLKSDGSQKSDDEVIREAKMKELTVKIDRCPTSQRESNKVVGLHVADLNSKKQVKNRSTAIHSKKYITTGVEVSPGAGYLRCSNCKKWFSDEQTLQEHSKDLIQCNICIRALPAGYNNYERPFFCTKQELQLHFRGKHTKQYLEMVAAKTGRPAGKVVQLGRHNSAKPDLNIWVNKKASKIGPDAEALIKDPLPTISVNSPDPSNLSTCNFREKTFQGNNFKVHHAPEGGWKQGQRMPYSSTTRNGRFSVNAVRKQAKSSVKAEPLLGPVMMMPEEESCTITEMEEESVFSGVKHESLSDNSAKKREKSEDTASSICVPSKRAKPPVAIMTKPINFGKVNGIKLNGKMIVGTPLQSFKVKVNKTPDSL